MESSVVKKQFPDKVTEIVYNLILIGAGPMNGTKLPTGVSTLCLQINGGLNEIEEKLIFLSEE